MPVIHLHTNPRGKRENKRIEKTGTIKNSELVPFEIPLRVQEWAFGEEWWFVFALSGAF